MASQNYYEGLQHVVHISTNIEKPCEHCTIQVGGERLADSINHYIEQHGYKLLHVGTETGIDMNGNTSHSTVAILGR